MRCGVQRETLSSSTYVATEIALPTGLLRERVSRAEFENLIRPYVEEMISKESCRNRRTSLLAPS